MKSTGVFNGTSTAEHMTHDVTTPYASVWPVKRKVTDLRAQFESIDSHRCMCRTLHWEDESAPWCHTQIFKDAPEREERLLGQMCCFIWVFVNSTNLLLKRQRQKIKNLNINMIEVNHAALLHIIIWSTLCVWVRVPKKYSTLQSLYLIFFNLQK